MLKVPIDNTGYQEFLLPFEGEFITITLNFRIDVWFLDLKFKDKSRNGMKLSSNVLMLQGMNLPFDIIIDSKETGLDPFSLEAFSLDRFDFNIIEREELATIRGFEVE